jgi:hypothetical protein
VVAFLVDELGLRGCAFVEHHDTEHGSEDGFEGPFLI